MLATGILRFQTLSSATSNVDKTNIIRGANRSRLCGLFLSWKRDMINITYIQFAALRG